MSIVINLLDHQITEEIYAGNRTLVYRGMRESDQQPIVIKLLRNEYPSFNELVQFRNQYTIAKNINCPNIISTYSLESYNNGYALVMEDFGGISLKQWIGKESGLSLEDFLQIAIDLCNTVNILYQQRIIHKDIKPANILIHPETKQVKLIDFGIASLLPRETQEIQNANTLEGTLAYLSPEQTGRMNRGIDYRSDFYSLGITFYELLTGQLPFVSEDPIELVHCHLAKTPISVHEISPQIPLVLSKIISKLMAKNAEDRYQSALGIKHDLELCLTQLQGDGEIKFFEIGQRDLSDRFLIPEKLYGRQAEVNTLLEAFERVADGASELMLVAGFSGIGKTAVVNEVHKPIVRQRGYFIKGKFDQFNRNIPLSAFVQALRDLMGQLLSESDEQLAQWRTQILTALGKNGQVLIEVIPELELIIGKQPIAPELSGSAVQNRFNLLFQKFIEVFTTAEHPLAVFLDDLQWADSASLQLIKLLMSDNGYLLMLGAYRDNEVSPIHPFVLTVEEIKKANAIVNTITLAPLDLADTNYLVADTLKCSIELAEALTELIDRKTKGNPLFTTQFLKVLYEEGYIRFEHDRRYWECDIAQVNALALTDDVVDFMAVQLQKLPTETQQVLKLAACVGNQFDLETLAIISEQSPADTAAALWKALQEGFILPTSQVYKFFQSNDSEQFDPQHSVNSAYRFLHDRVQQAAYYLIPEQERAIAHYQIGKLLLPQLSLNARTEQIFELVNHWNTALELVHNAEEKVQLANLNWLAGRKAKVSVAYGPALQYFKTGIALLASDCWQMQPGLALNLYEGGIKTALLCGDYLQMDAWAEYMLQQRITLLTKIKIYDVQIQAQMAQAKPTVAIQIALDALKLLEITFPETPTPSDIEEELQRTRALWEQQKISELIDLPLMSDPEKIAAIVILSSIFAPSFIGKPEILPLIACQQVQLSIRYGNCGHSAFGYSNYSAILNTLCHDLEASYQFGQLAIHLVDKLNATEVKARTFNQSAIFSMHGKVHLREILPILQEGCRSGIESGDLEFAGYAAYNWSQYSYFSGLNLRDLQQGCKTYGALLSQINQKISLSYNQLVYQVTLNLLEPSENPCCLVGEAFDEQVALDEFIENQVFSGIQYLFTHKIALGCFFSNFEPIAQYIDQAERYLDASTGMIMVPEFYFFSALASFQSVMDKSAEEQAQAQPKIEQYLAEMGKWAVQAPINFQHKFDLLRAEQRHLMGDLYLATDFYDRAIAGAKANGFIQDEALANELAAKFYLGWGKTKIAQDYLTHAYYGYVQWGATAKVQDLEHHYPQLLAPILQQQQMALSATETVFATTSLTTPQALGSQSSTSGSTSISAALDLATVLKASQTLSSEIQLDKLLATLLHMVLENAGADKGALLMPHDHQWFVEAVATVDHPAQIQAIALSSSSEVPQSLINNVKRSREPVVIIDALTHPTLAVDAYVLARQPKSLLCTPILNQGKLVAILYLENRFTIGAFTRDRVELLNFLCAQAAISLENARLYQQAQTYAQQLEQSQLQIIQTEKMSALGNLVAGVAHEINNPVGFIAGNLQEAKENVRDLITHLSLYRDRVSESAITDHAEEIDLDYLVSDLPKMLNSMQTGCDRIKGISTSLRTFSRADSDRPVAFNLHEGIDSTILILKHRLKADSNRPEIQVIKNYGNLPLVECYAGQLNQVFMNILANAIDTLNDSNAGKSYAEIEQTPNSISITTSLDGNHVKVAIADNGKGMSDEVKQKVFDHLFTTKEVGKGTGLGLAIAQQIIVEKHHGTIGVNSELGQGTEFIISLPLENTQNQ